MLAPNEIKCIAVKSKDMIIDTPYIFQNNVFPKDILAFDSVVQVKKQNVNDFSIYVKNIEAETVHLITHTKIGSITHIDKIS